MAKPKKRAASDVECTVVHKTVAENEIVPKSLMLFLDEVK